MELLKKRREDDRGAAAIVVSAFLVIVVIICALIIDGGSIRVNNRNMQSIADVTAMDLSRRLDGVSTVDALKPTMDAALAKIKARNTQWSSSANITYKLGTINSSGQFVEATGTAVPSAVKATSTQTAQWLTSSRTDTSARSSVAAVTIAAGGDCFSIGSYAGVLNTSGAYGLNPFFQKMFAQAVTFGNTSTAANWDWLKIAGEKINMTAVGQRLGYSTIDDFRNASVNLGTWYNALYQQLLVDAPDSETYKHVNAVRSMINNVGPLPMNKILGPNLKGVIWMSSLDVLGGMMTYYNDGRSVNPNFDSTWTSTFSQGPTNITYFQGPRMQCAKNGETVSTAGSDATRQIYMQLNGTLTPNNFTGNIYYPGLVNTTAPLNLQYMGLGLSVEPVELTYRGSSCTSTSKSLTFDLSKGSFALSLPGPQGGNTYAGSQSTLYTYLNGYGNVKIDWGFNLNFTAKLALAPSTGNTVTATASDLNKPLYIIGNEGKFTYDVSGSVNNFNYFRVLKDSSQYNDITSTLSTADLNHLKEAITMGYVNYLLDRSNSNSFFNNYVNGSLGFSGSSIWGTPIVIDNLNCGSSGGTSSMRLVG